MRAAEKFVFEGRVQAFPDLARRFTAYGPNALRTYLRAGAANSADLAAMDRDAAVRRRLGQKRSAKRCGWGKIDLRN